MDEAVFYQGLEWAKIAQKVIRHAKYFDEIR